MGRKTMNVEEFKETGKDLIDENEINHLCFSWLRAAIEKQEPKVRRLLRAALAMLTTGIEIDKG
jgi:hypothetical protein